MSKVVFGNNISSYCGFNRNSIKGIKLGGRNSQMNDISFGINFSNNPAVKHLFKSAESAIERDFAHMTEGRAAKNFDGWCDIFLTPSNVSENREGIKDLVEMAQGRVNELEGQRDKFLRQTRVDLKKLINKARQALASNNQGSKTDRHEVIQKMDGFLETYA